MARLPERLHQRAYLAAYHPDRRKLVTRGSHKEMVNAALLADLYLDGLLTDEGGRPRAQRPRGRLDLDPLRMELFTRIEESPGRRWAHWVRSKAGPAYRLTRAELATSRVIRLEDRRLLGVIPAPPRVEPLNPLVPRELVDRARRVVLGPGPVIRDQSRDESRDDVRDAALAALAVAVELPGISGVRERWGHKDRIREAEAVIAPVAKALRTVAQRNRSSAG